MLTHQRVSVQMLTHFKVSAALPATSERQVFTPHRVFVVNETAATAACSSDDTCPVTYAFHWRGVDSCQAR